MKMHYVWAFCACGMAVIWGWNVAEGNAVRASLDVLAIACYVAGAEFNRKRSAPHTEAANG